MSGNDEERLRRATRKEFNDFVQALNGRCERNFFMDYDEWYKDGKLVAMCGVYGDCWICDGNEDNPEALEETEMGRIIKLRVGGYAEEDVLECSACGYTMPMWKAYHEMPKVCPGCRRKIIKYEW